MLRAGLFFLSLVALPFNSQAEDFDYYSASDIHLGAEFNPLSALASSDDWVYISGGVSVFQQEQSAEIAFPFYYKNVQTTDEQFTVLAIGAQYRKYFNHDIQGYYLSGATQLVNVNSSDLRLGLGFGVGYRKMFDSGLYWGMGVVLGRYFGGSDDEEEYDQLNSFETSENEDFFVDVELLKVGMLF